MSFPGPYSRKVMPIILIYPSTQVRLFGRMGVLENVSVQHPLKSLRAPHGYAICCASASDQICALPLSIRTCAICAWLRAEPQTPTELLGLVYLLRRGGLLATPPVCVCVCQARNSVGWAPASRAMVATAYCCIRAGWMTAVGKLRIASLGKRCERRGGPPDHTPNSASQRSSLRESGAEHWQLRLKAMPTARPRVALRISTVPTSARGPHTRATGSPWPTAQGNSRSGCAAGR